MKYREFKSGINDLAAKPAVVAELLRVGCEENASNGGIKAIEMTFHRIIGKPEKPLVIKRTVVRTVFPDATEKAKLPAVSVTAEDEMDVPEPDDKPVVLEEADSPSHTLKKLLDEVGDKGRGYAYEVKDNPWQHTVAEVLVCNLYALAMAGGNLSAIQLLFDYMDGVVADVIRLEGEDTILLENYADIAPYEAVLGDDNVWYIETEAVG